MKKLVYFTPLIIVALLVIFLIIFNIGGSDKKDVISTESLSYLETLESKKPTQSNEETTHELTSLETETETTIAVATEAESPTLQETDPVSDPVIDSLHLQINTLNVPDLTPEHLALIRSQFENTVIIGDSMAQAVLEYDLLDSSHVFFLRSATIDKLTDQINAAADMYPANVIFFTGLNDTNYYVNIDDYINTYKSQLELLRSRLPGVNIYISSLLPPSDSLAAVRDDLARAPIFDIRLREMCMELNINYIDAYWMVKQELYIDDNIHMNYDFYKVWIQYVSHIMS